jgi:hypothetical protein
LKLVKDEALNEAWTKYRDDQAKLSRINIIWIYATFLLLLTAYATALVFLPSPDHKVFIQFDRLPEKQADSEVSSSGTASMYAHQQQPDDDGYMPLTRFLESKK